MRFNAFIINYSGFVKNVVNGYEGGQYLSNLGDEKDEKDKKIFLYIVYGRII